MATARQQLHAHWHSQVAGCCPGGMLAAVAIRHVPGCTCDAPLAMRAASPCLYALPALQKLMSRYEGFIPEGDTGPAEGSSSAAASSSKGGTAPAAGGKSAGGKKKKK